jgi:alanine racemase
MTRPETGSETEASLGALRGAWVDVDLDRAEANFRRLARRMVSTEGRPARICAVLKADAFGHGAPMMALTLEEAGADWIAVALLEEGLELRRAGVELPILCLGPAQPDQLPLFARHRITPAVSSLWEMDLWAAFAHAHATPGHPFDVHVLVDTGMKRLGLNPDQVDEALRRLRHAPELRLGGWFSHFADADDLASARNQEQRRAYQAALERLTPEERDGAILHLANSAGALHQPDARHRMVRLGLALYGLDPAGEDDGLQPVMSVRARLIHVRPVAAGDRMGYGGRYTAPEAGRTGVLPVGYADGYSWHLSNRAEVLIRGRRAPVAGAVSMDLTIVDVSRLPGDLAVGEEAVLMGEQAGPLGEGRVSARELASLGGSMVYEVLCRFGQRLPRRYLRDGRPVAVDSRWVRPAGLHGSLEDEG